MKAVTKEKEIYFPAFHAEQVKCWECEKKDNCSSSGKHQATRRDFEVTSGRCPKIPDRRGFVDKSERENQRNAYPLLFAELGGDGSRIDDLLLSLSVPFEKKLTKVYQTKSGFLFFNTKEEINGELHKIKRALNLYGINGKEEMIREMNRTSSDYSIFPCEIADFTI